MTSTKKRIAAALTVATITIGFTIPAMAAKAPDESVRMSSYKGSALEVGERSGLIIGPSGTNYTVTSSDPDTVAVEQVLTFWVAVAKAEGSAKITRKASPTLGTALWAGPLEMGRKLTGQINGAFRQNRKALNGSTNCTTVSNEEQPIKFLITLLKSHSYSNGVRVLCVAA